MAKLLGTAPRAVDDDRVAVPALDDDIEIEDELEALRGEFVDALARVERLRRNIGEHAPEPAPHRAPDAEPVRLPVRRSRQGVALGVLATVGFGAACWLWMRWRSHESR